METLFRIPSQTLIHRCQRKLNRNPYIITDSCGSSSRTASESIDGDDIRAASGDTACNSGDIVNGRNLNNDRLFIFGRFFEGVNQLPQILDGVNVVMRSG